MARNPSPTPPPPRGEGGPLLAIIVWVGFFGVGIGFFAALDALGASPTVLAVVGIPSFVVLVYAAGQLARRLRSRTAPHAAAQIAPERDRRSVDRELWSVPGLGTTWIERGRPYWTRRTLLWLSWAALTTLVATITVGIASGAASTPSARTLTTAIAAAVNLLTFVGVLLVAWPTTERLAAKLDKPSATRGAGAALGLAAIASPVFGTLLLPAALLGTSGVLLAVLVLYSLPQLPQEGIAALRRTQAQARSRRHH
jgi:hypothetical protein